MRVLEQEMNEVIRTQHATNTELPAILANQILDAMNHGSLEELKTGLAQAERLATHHPANQQTEEQFDLLGAVAGDMKHSITRYGRLLSPNIEGMEVHLQLLRHLAHPTPATQ
jgi:hypothetical protein